MSIMSLLTNLPFLEAIKAYVGGGGGGGNVVGVQGVMVGGQTSFDIPDIPATLDSIIVATWSDSFSAPGILSSTVIKGGGGGITIHTSVAPSFSLTVNVMYIL
jgi:hypothetical protein